MVSTVVRRIGVVGAMTLAGAGVAAGSAFAATDAPNLTQLPGDKPATTTGGLWNQLGSTVHRVPVVGGILSGVLEGAPGHFPQGGQHPQHSQQWHPSYQSHSHDQNCGCHHAPPPPPKHCA